MSIAIVILALVTLQRLGELVLSSRNTRRLLSRGAHEVGAGHYPLIVAVHVAWLACLWWLAPGRAIDPFWLAMFVLLQIVRIWVIATLGRRWTTRIIVAGDEKRKFVPPPPYIPPRCIVHRRCCKPSATGCGTRS